MRTLAILTTVFVFLSSYAYAEDDRDLLSGNALLPYCKAGIDGGVSGGNNGQAVYSGICAGIIIGVSSAMRYNAKTNVNSLLCAHIPVEASNGQLARVVIRYMETHPKELHEPLTTLAALALKDAWPCK
jgi:hypothetical protein